MVCRHTCGLIFTIHFLPGGGHALPSEASSNSGIDKKTTNPAEFWETLDKECWSRKKGKSVIRSHFSVSIKSEDRESCSCVLSFSTFGQLLSMLASPVINRSSLLTDKLLRLLSLISLG